MKSSGDLAHLGRTTSFTLSLEICRRPRSNPEKTTRIKGWGNGKREKQRERRTVAENEFRTCVGVKTTQDSYSLKYKIRIIILENISAQAPKVKAHRFGFLRILGSKRTQGWAPWRHWGCPWGSATWPGWSGTDGRHSRTCVKAGCYLSVFMPTHTHKRNHAVMKSVPSTLQLDV